MSRRRAVIGCEAGPTQFVPDVVNVQLNCLCQHTGETQVASTQTPTVTLGILNLPDFDRIILGQGLWFHLDHELHLLAPLHVCPIEKTPWPPCFSKGPFRKAYRVPSSSPSLSSASLQVSYLHVIARDDSGTNRYLRRRPRGKPTMGIGVPCR